MFLSLVDILKRWLVQWLTQNKLKVHIRLNNGFSTTFSSGDGVALFSTAHPLVSGGTNSNRPSSGADLNETSLEDAIIQIGKYTDERGLKIAATT